MKSIGSNIRRIRERKGFSQEYVAQELGINQSTYGKLERDDANISVERLIKISEIFKEDLSISVQPNMHIPTTSNIPQQIFRISLSIKSVTNPPRLSFLFVLECCLIRLDCLL
jgi:transcriptional regulator with XRE-family HTH domain